MRQAGADAGAVLREAAGRGVRAPSARASAATIRSTAPLARVLACSPASKKRFTWRGGGGRHRWCWQTACRGLRCVGASWASTSPGTGGSAPCAAQARPSHLGQRQEGLPLKDPGVAAGAVDALLQGQRLRGAGRPLLARGQRGVGARGRRGLLPALGGAAAALALGAAGGDGARGAGVQPWTGAKLLHISEFSGSSVGVGGGAVARVGGGASAANPALEGLRTWAWHQRAACILMRVPGWTWATARRLGQWRAGGRAPWALGLSAHHPILDSNRKIPLLRMANTAAGSTFHPAAAAHRPALPLNRQAQLYTTGTMQTNWGCRATGANAAQRSGQ